MSVQTPRPWSHKKWAGTDHAILDADGEVLFEVEERLADLIVRAVNNLEQLEKLASGFATEALNLQKQCDALADTLREMVNKSKIIPTKTLKKAEALLKAVGK